MNSVLATTGKMRENKYIFSENVRVSPYKSNVCSHKTLGNQINKDTDIVIERSLPSSSCDGHFHSGIWLSANRGMMYKLLGPWNTGSLYNIEENNNSERLTNNVVFFHGYIPLVHVCSGVY